MDVDTGITSEVFTIKSETKLIDIFNNIINKKSEACLNIIDSLNLDKNTKNRCCWNLLYRSGNCQKIKERIQQYSANRYLSPLERITGHGYWWRL